MKNKINLSIMIMSFVVIIIMVVTSCYKQFLLDNNFDETLQGTWSINYKYQFIEFKNDSIIFKNVLNMPYDYGEFFNNSTPQYNKVKWLMQNNTMGEMIFKSYLYNSKTQAIIVNGLPYSKNNQDTLYRVKLIVGIEKTRIIADK